MTLLYPALAIVAGFALLIWSADQFVLGASNTARNFSISPLIVGIVIVGLGTSAPEIATPNMEMAEHLDNGHAQYRSWCPDCVEAFGREWAHSAHDSQRIFPLLPCDWSICEELST